MKQNKEREYGTSNDFLIVLGEWWEARKSSRRLAATATPTVYAPRWLPTPGNAIFTVIFTLLVIFGLLWAQSAGALPLAAPAAASTGTIAYQGRLADAAGSPVTNTINSIVKGGASDPNVAFAWRLRSTRKGYASVRLAEVEHGLAE